MGFAALGASWRPRGSRSGARRVAGPSGLLAELGAILDRHAAALGETPADALPIVRREVVAMLDAAERSPVGFLGWRRRVHRQAAA